MERGLIISTILISILLFAASVQAYFVSKILVPLIMTPKPLIDEILERMELEKGEILYDLGSGDGRLTIRAAQKYNVKTIGYEISPLLILISRFMKLRSMLFSDLVEFRNQNFIKADYNSATVIYLHLNSTALGVLGKRFAHHLDEDIKIFSYEHEIPALKLVMKHQLSNDGILYQHKREVQEIEIEVEVEKENPSSEHLT